MQTDARIEPQNEWQVRPLGSEAAVLEAGLRSSPYLDASFLGSLVGRDLVQGLNGREAWTAWLGGEPQGFLILDPGPDAVTEVTLAVLPGARRLGVGRRLMEFGVERGQAEAWSSLSLLVQTENEGALAFFEAQGFLEVPTQLKGYRCFRRNLRT